jgi:hypothetical protein
MPGGSKPQRDPGRLHGLVNDRQHLNRLGLKAGMDQAIQVQRLSTALPRLLWSAVTAPPLVSLLHPPHPDSVTKRVTELTQCCWRIDSLAGTGAVGSLLGPPGQPRAAGRSIAGAVAM